MARPRAAQPAGTRPARSKAAPLGPGLHPGVIELCAAGAPRAAGSARPYRVRLGTGRRFAAALAPGVSPAFAEECMRDGRTVVLMDTPDGAAIAGALQIASAPVPDERGTLCLEAKHVRLRAEQTLAIEVPGASLLVEPNGVVRMEGDRLVIDMAAIVRIFSARVEIP